MSWAALAAAATGGWDCRQLDVRRAQWPGRRGWRNRRSSQTLGTTRANLSNHLTCLRECGLVTATLEGWRVRFELVDRRLGDALRMLASLDLPGSCDT